MFWSMKTGNTTGEKGKDIDGGDGATDPELWRQCRKERGKIMTFEVREETNDVQKEKSTKNLK